MGDPESLSLRSGVQRLERGIRSNAVLAGLQAALEWRTRISPDKQELTAAVHAAAAAARTALVQLDAVELVTPAEHAGLLAFRLAGACPLACVAELGARRIATRAIESHDAIRISCGFFTSAAEIDALLDATVELSELLAGTRVSEAAL